MEQYTDLVGALREHWLLHYRVSLKPVRSLLWSRRLPGKHCVKMESFQLACLTIIASLASSSQVKGD